MSRILIAVALITSIAAFNVEAQSRGSVKQTGAFRKDEYRDSGSYRQYPTAGQRHNDQINKSVPYRAAPSWFPSSWKTTTMVKNDPRPRIQTNNRATRLNKSSCSGKAPCQR